MPTQDSVLEEVDAFLAAPKRLDDKIPVWGTSVIPAEYSARWLVTDDLGIGRGELKFKALRNDKSRVSIVLLLRKYLIYRIDIVPDTVREYNPPWAASLGLPAFTNGSHMHTWEDNRKWVSLNDFGRLPARRPLPKVRRLPQALAEFCGAINVTLEADQRGFVGPAPQDLFDFQAVNDDNSDL